MSRLGELNAKVDGFFARVQARHGDDMQCGSGCSDCCHVRLTITGVEAAAIRGHVEAWPAERRRALAGGDEHGGDEHGGDEHGGAEDRCAMLDPDGRCQIYEVRPIVCRSHGAPIRMRKRSLPVIESCFRNFTRTEPAPDCILDQETLSALVLAVDRDARGDRNLERVDRVDRVDLAGLVAELANV